MHFHYAATTVKADFCNSRVQNFTLKLRQVWELNELIKRDCVTLCHRTYFHKCDHITEADNFVVAHV